jgi:GNAT superfamily N-acetyltransferase
MVEVLDIYNVHKFADGIVKCLSDGFGKILCSKEEAIQILLSKIQAGHFIVVAIEDGVVATATGFVEQKLIHAGDPKYKAKPGSYVFHIEDVVTRTDKRGNGYGAACVKYLCEIASDEGAYKIILDASLDNYRNFYQRLGYKNVELCLRKNI